MKFKSVLNKKLFISSIVLLTAALSWYTYNGFNAKQSIAFAKEIGESDEEEAEESKNKIQFIEAQWRQEFERTKDPETGTVPTERIFSALEYKSDLIAARDASGTQSRGISGISWVERGPTNIGGRTRALLFDKNDATLKTVFAGAIGGGLWRCNDITLATPTWIKISDTYENVGISTIVQNPTNPQIMYYGTGEGWLNLGAQNGLGIWKSTDGGNTWNHLPSTISIDFTTVQRMTVTANGDVYACTAPAGVMKSTDGGITWTNVLRGKATDIEIAANGDMYASLGIFSPGSIWKSLNGATVGNANTWTNITPTSPTGFQRMEIGVSPSDAQTLYVVCQGGASNDGTDMFYSNTGGMAWTPCNVNSAVVQDPIPTSTNFTRGQAWYDLVCVVDPNTPTTVYIGGVDIHKSIDAGGNFTPLTKWTSLVTPSPAIPVVHADQHTLVFKPGSSDNALFGNDGGVFYGSSLSLPTYTIPTKDFGYNVTQFYCLAMHPAIGSNYFLAGAQDNGTQKFNGPTAGASPTTEATGGDGAFCHIDQSNPSFQFTSYVYSSYYRSTNGGVSFPAGVNDATHGQFINPTDYDDVSKVFYGDYTVVATRIGGSYARWLTTAGNINVGVPVTNFNGASVTNVYVSPNVSNRVYFGLANGSIVYVDGANLATAPAGVVIKTGSGSVSGIAIETTNENHILATYSNYGVESVWETIDGGVNWAPIEGNLPDMPVRWVVFNPTNADQALIATEIGVWSTDDLNGSSTEWNPTGYNMPNCRVDMLQVRASDNVIGAATYGRGVFTTTLNNTTVPQINFSKTTSFVSEKNPVTLTGCGTYGYKDVPVALYISKAPVGDAVVNISLNPNSTATQGQDFSLSATSVTFPSGSTAPQLINVRVFNDHNIEPTEYLELSMAVAGATNAIKATVNQNFSMQITDDEVAPSGPFTGKVQVGDFTTNLGGSSPLQGSQTDKKMQYLYRASELLASGVKAGAITGFSFAIGTKGSVQPFMGFTIKMGTTTNSALVPGPFLSNAGYQTVYSAPANGYSSVGGDNEFTFATPFMWDGTSNIVFEYCYNNSAAPPAPPVALPAGTGDDVLTGQTTSYISQARAASTNQPADDGCAFTTTTLAASNTFRPLVKMFQLQPQTAVETVLNSTMKYNVGPFETVYFYSATGKVIAKVVNQSNFNYGCVQLDVDRAGTGSTIFNSATPKYFLTAKSIYFTPQFDNPAGPLNITVYLTSAEKTSWETATANVFAAATIIKVKGLHIFDVTPANPSTASIQQSIATTTGVLGTDFSISGNFTTGFSGVAVGIIDNTVLALKNNVLLSGNFIGLDSYLKWNVDVENNLQSTNLQRSYNGIDFTDITTAINVQKGNYSFVDNPTNYKVYYRVKFVDNSGRVAYSNIILLSKNGQLNINVSPNPFTSNINVQLTNQTAGNVLIKVTDVVGKTLYQKNYTNVNNQVLNVDLQNSKLSSGTYILSVTIAGNTQTFKVVKY